MVAYFAETTVDELFVLDDPFLFTQRVTVIQANVAHYFDARRDDG